MLIIVGFSAGILGYGYWHAYTHASFYIHVDVKDGAKGGPGTIAEAEISLLDSERRVLATGIGDEHYNYVHLIHPEVGDCQEVEKTASFSKESRKAWQECFEQLSTWIAKWADRIGQVDVKTPDCRWTNIPVTVTHGNSDWLLWWVPHPHIGGKPYSHYSLTVTVAKNHCEN